MRDIEKFIVFLPEPNALLPVGLEVSLHPGANIFYDDEGTPYFSLFLMDQNCVPLIVIEDGIKILEVTNLRIRSPILDGRYVLIIESLQSKELIRIEFNTVNYVIKCLLKQIRYGIGYSDPPYRIPRIRMMITDRNEFNSFLIGH